MTTTLAALKIALCGSDGSQGVLQDSSYYANIATDINEAVNAIAVGIRMPNGETSPPLPDLYDSDTVATDTDAAYEAMPSDYQRHLFMVVDENGNKIAPPKGGDYYNFKLFLRQADKKDLSRAGSVSMVCLKGSNLYYQGIPSASYDLTVHFYRAPEDMSEATDTVDGIPDQFATKLIKHYVAKEIMGSGIEDGDNSVGKGEAYHTRKFFEVMTDFMDWIGEDDEPVYYGEDESVDGGVCD